MDLRHISEQQSQLSTHLKGCYASPLWPYLSTFPPNVVLPQIEFALHNPASSLTTIYWTKLPPCHNKRDNLLTQQKAIGMSSDFRTETQSWKVIPALEGKSKSLLELPGILPAALCFNISLNFTSYCRILALI